GDVAGFGQHVKKPLPVRVELVAIEGILAAGHAVEHLVRTAARHRHRHAAVWSAAAAAGAGRIAARVALVAAAETAIALLIAALVIATTEGIAILAFTFAAAAPLGGGRGGDEQGRADHKDPQEPRHRPYSARGENPSVGWGRMRSRRCPRRLFITPWP